MPRVALVSFRALRGLTRPAVMCLALAAGAGCAPQVEADTSAARAHVQALAGTIGDRPHGSAAATRAREYIVGELRGLGFTVRVQDADAVDESRGLTTRVRNVIAWLDGEEPTAVALVSHYDSRPGAPGAIDDGVGVAVSLAAARELAAEARRYSLAVLVTDGEELGLMGARALVQDPEVAQRVGAIINLEGMGASGPFVLFEATGGAVAEAWARSVAPEGTSLGNEVYRRLPNSTDFTILRGLGVDGINLVPVDDAYAYHTSLDQSDRLTDQTLAHGIVTVTSTVRALDDMTLPADPGEEQTTFFDLSGRIGIVYASWTGWVLTVMAVLVAMVAWVFLTIDGRKRVKVGGLLFTALASAIVTAGATGGLAGAAWILPALRSEEMPWYAAPWFYYVFIASGGLAGGWAMARLNRRVLPAKRVWRSAAAIWWLALPVLALLAVLVQRQAPGVSFMFVGPLLAGGLAGLFVRWAPWIVRVASGLPLFITVVLWAGDATRLLSFVAALAGWLPVVPPWWAFAALIGIPGFIMAIPFLAFAAGLPALPRAVWGAAATIAPLVVAGSAALALPAYRDQRPQRRVITYVSPADPTQAAWIVGGREVAFDLDAGPDGQPFEPVAPGASSSVLSLSGTVERHRYLAPATAAATSMPAVVTASGRVHPDGRREVNITVLPRELVTAQVRLPAGVTPVDASLAGRISGGRWVATYAAVPTAGFTIRCVLGPPADPAAPLADLAGLDVVLSAAILPGATPVSPVPDWLPAHASTWTTRAVFVVPVTPALVR